MYIYIKKTVLKCNVVFEINMFIVLLELFYRLYYKDKLIGLLYNIHSYFNVSQKIVRTGGRGFHESKVFNFDQCDSALFFQSLMNFLYILKNNYYFTLQDCVVQRPSFNSDGRVQTMVIREPTGIPTDYIGRNYDDDKLQHRNIQKR